MSEARPGRRRGSERRDADSLPRVSVVIPNWNGAELLARVLDSLGGQLYQGFETLVVDNGSTDTSLALLESEFPETRVVALPTNLGFAGAVNAGIEKARGEIIALLNNDAVADPGWLGALVDALDRHPEVGSIASRMLDLGDPGRIDSAGDQLGIFPSNIGHGEPDDARFREPAYVLSACAGAAAFRRELFEDVGLFDERFFAYMEDVDLGVRAQLRGWDCLYEPRAVVYHEGSQTSKRMPDRRFFLLARNSLLIFFQFMPPLRRMIWAPVAVARVLWNSVRRGPGLHVGWRAIVETLSDWRRIRARRQQARDTGVLSWEDLKHRFVAPWVHSTFSLPLLGSGDGFRRPVAPAPPRSAAGVFSAPAGVHSEDSDPIDVVVVNWNGARYLPVALSALFDSSVPVRVILVDNASTDRSLSVVSGFQQVEVVALDRNVGYAGGANVGLARSESRFVMIMNPDVLLEPNHLEVLRDRLDGDPTIGAAQGKLHQITSESFLVGRPERHFIDSAGHVLLATRMVVDRGQGEKDNPRFHRECSVFSATGASLFLRRDMLRDVSSGPEVFDPDFFAYKEDIDLCWRARLLGWDIRYVPAAVAHHVRTMPGGDRTAWHDLPVSVRLESWKNHYLVVLKNDRVRDMLRYLPQMLLWEIGRLGYALIRDPAMFRAYPQVLRCAPNALRDRRRNMEIARRRGVRLGSWTGQGCRPVEAESGLPDFAARPSV